MTNRDFISRRLFLRVPVRFPLTLFCVLSAPRFILVAWFFWRYPELRTAAILGRLLLPVLPILVLSAGVYAIRYPVEFSPQEFRLGWFFKLKWSDISSATIRTVWGMRIFEIRRHRARPWQFILFIYPQMPTLFAAHAPSDIREKLLVP